MKCYLDTSIVIRKIFGEPNPLKELEEIELAISSWLLRLEGFRTLDRVRMVGRLSAGHLMEKKQAFQDALETIGLLPLTSFVLRRAEEPFPVTLATLDSIHLATALVYREKTGEDFSFATHDGELAYAARLHGFRVIGC